MDMPLVSVVMPVYNSSRFLERAIDSILCQSFTDFEFIILNDGSTDNSDEIIKKYNDPRIRYINNDINRGLVEVLNQAVALAGGVYIARMDADDVAYPERLKKQVDFLLQNPNIKLTGSHVRLVDENSAPVGCWRYPTDSLTAKQEIKLSCCFAHPSVVFSKQIFDELGGYSQHCKLAGEDYDLWMRILDKYDGANTDEVLLDYRVHSASFSSQNLIKQTLACLAIKHNILIDSDVTASTLLENGIAGDEVYNSITNSCIFWVDLYVKMRNYAVCDELLQSLKMELKNAPDNRALLKTHKFEIKYNLKLWRPLRLAAAGLACLKKVL